MPSFKTIDPDKMTKELFKDKTKGTGKVKIIPVDQITFKGSPTLRDEPATFTSKSTTKDFAASTRTPDIFLPLINYLEHQLPLSTTGRGQRAESRLTKNVIITIKIEELPDA